LPFPTRAVGLYPKIATTDPEAPVFYSLPNGVGRLTDELVSRLGQRLRLSSPVTDLGELDADQVIVTLPADVASALVAPVSSAAAELLGEIDYASVVLVSLAFSAAGVDHPMAGSGHLVPAVEGRTITACSWASNKWSHVGTADTVVLRVSAGRYGNDRALALGDDALLEAVVDDLSLTMGLDAEPHAVRISRWERSLPQFRPGHLELVADIERAFGSLAARQSWRERLESMQRRREEQRARQEEERAKAAARPDTTSGGTRRR